MIRKLQIKIIAVSMGVLIIVFAVVFLTLNLFMGQASIRQADEFMQLVADGDGFPEMPSPETIFPAPEDKNFPLRRFGGFFYCKVDAQGNILELRPDMMFNFSLEEAREYVRLALENGRSQGNVDNMQFLRADKGYGSIIVFAEISVEQALLQNLTRLSLIVAAISCVLLSILVIMLSRWVVRPVRETFEKQRQFVSDAGHELKTPLTVISASADVLENEIGKNASLEVIQSQSGRMRSLVEALLTLAKSDEDRESHVLAAFNLSAAVRNTALEYESYAFEAGKTIETDIEENITLVGNKEKIQQLLSILLDNAIKHSSENGSVRVTLGSGEGKKTLRVYNDGPPVPSQDLGRIFERFYRGDGSRSRETGGFGLGLAIAKSIMELHQGEIHAKNAEGGVVFTASFPA